MADTTAAALTACNSAPSGAARDLALLQSAQSGSRIFSPLLASALHTVHLGDYAKHRASRHTSVSHMRRYFPAHRPHAPAAETGTILILLSARQKGAKASSKQVAALIER